MTTSIRSLARREVLRRALEMTVAAGLSGASIEAFAQPSPAQRDVHTMRGEVGADGSTPRFRDKWNGNFLVSIESMGSFTSSVADMSSLDSAQATAITLSLRPLITQAMTEWNRSRVPIRQVRGEEVPSVRIRQGVLAESTMLGWTNVLPHTREITISPSNIIESAVLNYSDLVQRGILDSSVTSLGEYANMLAALTVRHELGHALGLGHPTAGGADQPAGNFSVIIPATDFDLDEPSTMVAEHRVYFESLHGIHLRALVPADIRVSERDIDGVNLMWDGRATPRASLELLGCGISPTGCISP